MAAPDNTAGWPKQRRPSAEKLLCVVVARMAEGSGLEMNWHQGVGINVTAVYSTQRVRVWSTRVEIGTSKLMSVA